MLLLRCTSITSKTRSKLRGTELCVYVNGCSNVPVCLLIMCFQKKCKIPQINTNYENTKKNQISGLSDYHLLTTKELTPLPLCKQVSKASKLICRTHRSVEELPTKKKPDTYLRLSIPLGFFWISMDKKLKQQQRHLHNKILSSNRPILFVN